MEKKTKGSEPCSGHPELNTQGLCPVDPTKISTGEKKKKKPPPRNVRFVMKLLPEEHKRICQLAERAEVTPTEYARAKALDKGRTVLDRAPSVDRSLMTNAVTALGVVAPELRGLRDAVEFGDAAKWERIDMAIVRIEAAADALLVALGVTVQ